MEVSREAEKIFRNLSSETKQDVLENRKTTMDYLHELAKNDWAVVREVKYLIQQNPPRWAN